MRRSFLSLLFVLGLTISACGGGDTVTGPECTQNDDCVTGYLCIEQKCTAKAAVEIVTAELPDALVGADYEVALEAQGGVPPYTWSLLEGPTWLSIAADSGRLTGHPEQEASGLTVKVEVRDTTSGRDSSDERTFTINVVSCSDGETMSCTVEQDGKCMVGVQTCTDGHFGACENLDFSIDFEHCGPQCGPCEENRADACKQGLCACGDGSGCTAPDICCDGSCVDGSQDGNCGGCGRVCADALANSANPRCQDGQCLSDGCLPSWLDCDGGSQNGCELEVSVDNCGACGADCSAVEHVGEVVCEVGQDGASCGYSGDGTTGEGCELGWYDCDGDRGNGCETQADNNNCGGCALACSSQCLLHPDGDHYYCGCTTDDDCGSDGLCCSGECVLATDPHHCGACGNDCTTQVQHAPASCTGGQCNHGTCDPGWLDCDNNAANGCELAMDSDNCGSCGFSCGANAACDTASGTCTCTDNFADCMGGWTDGCETDITSTPNHCGSCDHDCGNDLQNVTTPLCTAGVCDYAGCSSGFADCDSNRSNGCEEGIWETTDCGTDCTNRVNCLDTIQNAGGISCAQGTCGFTSCLAGFRDCDTTRANGCEENIWETTDCGTDCTNRVDCTNTIQHASGKKCASGLCDYESCAAGFADCDTNRTNGCEENIWEIADCGTNCTNRVDCNQQVVGADNPYCNQGSCDYQRCGICAVNICPSDCNGDRTDGCETDLWEPGNCRTSCTDPGVDCNQQVQNAIGIDCRTGACNYSQCWFGYNDCDGDRSNGCEADLGSDSQNCGSCGHVCDEAADCVSGVCVSEVKKVYAGGFHTCAILRNDRVKCWGRNWYGQLGLGDQENRGNQPGEMGENLPYVDLGTGRTAKQLALGLYHTCALLDNNRVKCWGRNAYGQLGLGHTNDIGDQPNEMGNSLPYVNLGSGRTAIGISAGAYHTCAFLDNFRIKCWGRNNYGQLGQGDTNNRGDNSGEMGDFLPLVQLGTGLYALNFAVGYYHTCAATSQSPYIKCFGANGNGQLGLGDTAPRGYQPGEMGDNLPFVDYGGASLSLAGGGAYHNCIIIGDDIKCWGYNYYGQLGLGDTNNRGDNSGEMGSHLPFVDLAQHTVDDAWSGYYHTCVFLDDINRVKCWGRNNYGQLGLGDTNNRGDNAGEMGTHLPSVSLGTGRTANGMGLGGYHTCALLDNKRVKCWGYNGFGQLGLGDTNDRGDGPSEMGDNLPYVGL